MERAGVVLLGLSVLVATGTMCYAIVRMSNAVSDAIEDAVKRSPGNIRIHLAAKK